MMNKTLSIILYSSFIFLFFPSFTYNKCIEKIYKSHESILSSEFFFIKSYLNKSNSDSLLIYIEKNKRFKVIYNGKIIIGDHSKISNFNYDTNQLFIEKPDTMINKWLINEIEKDIFSNFLKDITKVNSIFLNNECTNIDSIKIVHNQLSIYNVLIDSFKVSKPDSFFSFNLDYDKIFKYDFR